MNKDLNVVVVGLGKTGYSCVRYLVRQGIEVAVVDSREAPPYLEEIRKNFPQIQVHLGDFNLDVLSQADELVISPGVSLHEQAITACLQREINVVGDIELFARAVKAPVIAITGSNGKSTVTSLVGKMAEAAGRKVKVGGNFGVPVLDLLDQETELYVLELSSFQLESTYSLRPVVAVILNISPDHMDRYRNLDEYLAAKQRIYSGCKVAIINRGDLLSYARVLLPPKIISFGVDKPSGDNFGIVDNWLGRGDAKLLAVDELKIKGLHNVENALAALALGEAIELPIEAMLQALTGFWGLPHRCQFIADSNNVKWYNDSKGTNVGATNSAIKGLGASINGKVVLIAGGIGKGANFSALRDAVAKYVRVVVLIGKDAQLIGQSLVGASKILYAVSITDAITICKKESLPSDIVLFSPACASFDMFNNFEHRGEVFVQEVKRNNR